MSIFNQFFQKQQNNPLRQQIDQPQFKQLVVTLDKPSLQKLVAQARQRGMSDKDIEDGVNFILNLQKQ